MMKVESAQSQASGTSFGKCSQTKIRVGSGWNPPLPLILAAWDHTTGLEKLLRLKQHIEYATEKGFG